MIQNCDATQLMSQTSSCYITVANYVAVKVASWSAECVSSSRAILPAAIDAIRD